MHATKLTSSSGDLSSMPSLKPEAAPTRKKLTLCLCYPNYIYSFWNYFTAVMKLAYLGMSRWVQEGWWGWRFWSKEAILLISPLFLRCDLCLRGVIQVCLYSQLGGNAAKIACHNELPQKLWENASPPHCPPPQSQLHALNYVTSKSCLLLSTRSN